MNHLDIEYSFFGRVEPLQLLKKRVLDLKDGYRQNMAVVGNRYIGKTSLLHKFIFDCDEEHVTCVYIDFENRDFSYVVNKFIGSLLYSYSKAKRIPPQEDVLLLIEQTKEHIPHTTAVMSKILTDTQKGKHNDAFLGLLALPEIYTNETNQYCVLIFDEFQNLEDFTIADAFQYLGKKIMTQKRCLYIFASSYPEVAQKIIAEKLSLLFGSFEVVTLDMFDLSSSQQCIEKQLKDVKIGAHLCNFMTDFTGGHPLYLNLICHELRNLAAIHRQSEVFMPLLAQSVENTIFNRWGVLNRHYELVIRELMSGKGHESISLVLFAMANGFHQLADLVEQAKLSRGKLNQKLKYLLEQGTILKNGNFYYIKDKLFRYWIKYVYQKRLKDIELSFDKQKKDFKEEFNRSVDRFKVNSRKDFSARVIELFMCFGDEAFYLNGRRYKLPTVKEAVPFRLRHENGNYLDVIKASTKDGMWFIVLKKDTATENEIGMIVQEIKKLDQRAERFLLISLSELDENTRLKALQERFWIWNERELNTLLTLFDQPYIVR